MMYTLMPSVLLPKAKSWASLHTVTTVAIAVCTAIAGCDAARSDQPPANAAVPPPKVVTADIQAGIERHIEEQSRLGNGYFRLPFEQQELALKLVRVHTEYLANLGPRRHFACVDLASTDGQVYDVDFFLAGDPGAMTVTETTVHKFNGQPLYAWEQKKDRTWQRVPVEDAPQSLLGVITGRDEFEFIYRATLPKMTDAARMWLPLPATDPFQTVEVTSINAPVEPSILEERKHGNWILFLELGPEASGQTVEVRFHVKRIEKTVYADQAPEADAYLVAESLVPINDDFRSIAAEVVEPWGGGKWHLEIFPSAAPEPEEWNGEM